MFSSREVGSVAIGRRNLNTDLRRKTMATAAMNSTGAAPAAAAQPSAPGGPIVVDTQHDDMVHDAQLDYYGCKLATSSSDRTVKIYDVSGDSYTHTATLQGHEGPVWEVSWSHPKFGVVLASCSFDGSVLVHRESRPHEWTLLHAARGLHDSSVNSVSFAPHEFGLMAAAASSDGRVSVLSHDEDDTWGVEYVRDNSLGVNAVSWAPYAPEGGEGGVAAAAAEGEAAAAAAAASCQPTIVTGGCDNRIRFWTRSASTGEWEEDPSPLGAEVSHADWVRDVAWAPPIAPGVDVVASCSEDRTVIVWTREGGRGATWVPRLMNAFDDPVWRLSWSVTGSVLAVSSGDNTVTLWKAGLDNVWRQVSHVEDMAGGGGGGAAGGVQQQ
eukprot:CAMPEP_0183293564 /NCGR_PEP_ID=MMETSP0160_2-20130417/2196_1 /TAXON_ID=2839 ORGANISM="Odontella Sinensis, Strain Grunow 1884" /NCGR_SAMPLE_ID=MMETSP0160_2 /ASSEMBLY_ACC=CAM_ASM_000250 /LENGTH=382 /DNA_ID=CAMNT_0025454701 /DNA_START=84 /DNA_END=1232 /DNA_ORIENTATION=+